MGEYTRYIINTYIHTQECELTVLHDYQPALRHLTINQTQLVACIWVLH